MAWLTFCSSNFLLETVATLLFAPLGASVLMHSELMVKTKRIKLKCYKTSWYKIFHIAVAVAANPPTPSNLFMVWKGLMFL